MAQALIKAGHSVTMVCGVSSSGVYDIPLWKGNVRRGYIDGIEVIQFPVKMSNYYSLLRRTVSFWSFAFNSIMIALREDYDLLFATSTPLTAALPGVVMKYFRKKPFVFEVRDLWPELPREMGVIKNPVVLGAMSFLEWISYRKADACVGLSPGIVEGIKKRAPKDLPVAMIPNASDLDLFVPGKREDLRIDGVSERDFVGVFTGTHGIANGLNAALDVALELKKRNRKDIKIVLIGDGREKPCLEKRAADQQLDNVIFKGRIPHLELAKMLGRFDVGLMLLANVPAFYYGTSPNKFFDYISSGIPVINNYPGWLADMITEYQFGVAIAPNDPVAFADALCYLADNPSKAQEMGRRARKVAEKRFSREDLASELVALINKWEHRVAGYEYRLEDQTL